MESLLDTFDSQKMAVNSVIQFSETFFDSLDRLSKAFEEYL